MKHKEKKKSDKMAAEQSPKIKRDRSFQTVKAFASYLGCIGIALGVMYYLNGTVGILLAIALSCALMISVGVTLIVMYSVKIELKLDKLSVSKGETLMCVISLNKKIVIPAPIIELYIDCTAHLLKETDICRVSLAGKESNVIKIPMTAKYSGAAQISIQEVFISDYLGIFRFRLKTAEMNHAIKLPVYPNIPNVPIQADFLKSAVLFSTDDDDEETNETAMVQTGMPGYDHREYYPGDPIKRINWKMSSKRDIYMVRLDEKPTGAGQVFFLDSPQLPENDFTLSIRDNIIEGMLAVFTMLVREGRETVFFFSEKGIWQRADVRNIADIHTIQQIMSNFEPCHVKNVVPPEIISMGKTPICFTAATDDFPQSAVQIISEIPDILLISTVSSSLPALASDMWIISSEFELKKQ